MLARDVAAQVSMRALLRELGFAVNQRTHRCSCPLHAGKNPSAFSWRETGEWFCFSCGRGGDKLALVQEAKRCDFKDALKFLAALAGVNLEDTRNFRDELARTRREHKQREIERARLMAVEQQAFLEARDEVLELEVLRRNAGLRLAKIVDWGFLQERFPGEEELAWAALELVANALPNAAARYTVAAFSDSESIAKFAMHPEERSALVSKCIEVGGVDDSRGHFVELVL
jgi:hypothetical protein